MPGERKYEGRLLTDSSPFAISEAFKMLRTNLFYTSKGDSCPVYGITSTYANSGKSLIMSNLAVSFSQLEKKVLLIDCDLRNSVIHKIFNLERAGGMSELLAGADTSIDRYIKKSNYPNLSIITAGGTPPNPAELLAGERMSKLLEFLKEHFDIIFIDLPPVLMVADALVISDNINGFLFAVRAEYDDYRDIKETISIMEQTGAKIVGFVLNDIDIKSGSRYGGKYGKYGKYGRFGRYGKYGKYGYYKYGKYSTYGKYGSY